VRGEQVAEKSHKQEEPNDHHTGEVKPVADQKAVQIASELMLTGTLRRRFKLSGRIVSEVKTASDGRRTGWFCAHQ
jgi:hypothetical protein